MPPPGVASAAASERNVAKLNKTSTNISGTTDNLRRQLKLIEAEIKEDQKGKKEYEDYLGKLNLQKVELQKRIDGNRDWLAGFEAQSEQGAFEDQYKKLLEEIQQIYEQAKEFHSKGIDLLIKDFSYHVAYKRWNDTFTAIPFKPK